MNLILLGPPAAGKGTQAQWILRDFDVVHVSTGDMLRKAIADGTDLGKLAKPLIDAGKLVPDDIVNGIIQEWLRAADPGKGIVFDGFPRTVAQAQALDEMLANVGRKIDAVVSIQVNEQVVVERIGGRWSCPKDGAVYHATNCPPQVIGKCDRCGADLIQRDDDKPEKIVERYKQYLEKTMPLVDYYRAQGTLLPIDGTRDTQAVYGEIQAALATL
ncbi:MAG: adenylate kinase [Myxococcales bacterium]|jgi:adenylate kinase|nr:adenylate kinase [Myxococcales bacterium]